MDWNFKRFVKFLEARSTTEGNFMILQLENQLEAWRSANGDHGSLLVVEDDLGLKPIWEYFIAQKCPLIELHWAISAETAIEMLSVNKSGPPPYDVIVVDVFLSGGMTGLDVIEFIRKSPWRGACEVILSSACDPKELRKHVNVAQSRTTFLPKPYLASGCMNAVLGALGNLSTSREQIRMPIT